MNRTAATLVPVLIAAPALALLGCNDPVAPEVLAGEYALVRIAGSPLPRTELGGTCGAIGHACITAGELALEADGTYRWSFDYDASSGDPFGSDGHFASQGTWSADSGDVFLVRDDGVRSSGTWSEGQVVLFLADAAWTFERRPGQ